MSEKKCIPSEIRWNFGQAWNQKNQTVPDTFYEFAIDVI